MLGLIKETFTPILNSLLFGDFKHLSSDKLLYLYAMLDNLEKVVKERKDEVKEALVQTIQRVGTRDCNKWRFEASKVKALLSERRAKLPDEAGLRNLLEAADIDLTRVYDKKEMWVINPSKIDRLVELGYLKQEDLFKLKKTSLALRVTVPAAMKKAMKP